MVHMLKKNILRYLSIIILIYNCGSPVEDNLVDDQTAETTITFTVNISDSSFLPYSSVLSLIDSSASVIDTIDISDTGTYSFNPVPDSDNYNLILNANGSIIDFGSYNKYNYSESGIYIGVVCYSGTITYHADWYGEDCFIVSENLYLGTEQIIAVNSNGTFTFYEREMEDGQKYSLYTFRDSDGNGEYNWDVDGVTYLQTENGAYSDINIQKEQIRISGEVSLETINYRALKVADNSFWVENYQSLEDGGSFNIYVSKGHTIDIMLTDSYRLPVRLAGIYTYTEDTVINSQSIDLHTITLNISDSTVGYSSNNLMVSIGQSPLVYNLYKDGEKILGSHSEDFQCQIEFRTFDRTTETNGVFLDNSFDDVQFGYGAFIKIYIFIDTNSDGVHNPSEPSSNIIYWGDTDGSGSPDWGVDYDDTVSDSRITEDIEINLTI